LKRLQLGKQFFSDYDEIIQLYIIEVVKNINAMVSHDKFHVGSRDSVREWLENYIKANPKKGGYVFALNHRRPGWFVLMFKTSVTSELFSWNIRVVPGGYEMQNHVYPDMLLLCNGFKTIMQNGLNKPKPAPSYDAQRGAAQGGYGDRGGYNAGYDNNYGSGYNNGGYNAGYNNAGYNNY
jgi:transcription elongation factor SPT6